MFLYCQKCYMGHLFDSLGHLCQYVGNVEGHPGDSLGYYLSAQKYYKVPR